MFKISVLSPDAQRLTTLRYGFVINSVKNDKAKKQQIAVFWLCSSNILDLSLKKLEKYKDPFLQLTLKNICFYR